MISAMASWPEGKRLDSETFVPFDKKAVTLLSKQGEATQLLA